jgi:hypothetical protein
MMEDASSAAKAKAIFKYIIKGIAKVKKYALLFFIINSLLLRCGFQHRSDIFEVIYVRILNSALPWLKVAMRASGGRI